MKKKIFFIICIVILFVIAILIVTSKKEILKDENGYYLSSSTINGKEAVYNNPLIPKGFKPIDTKTSMWGLKGKTISIENVNNGLVIEDKKRNQFVWIPVDGKDITLARKSFSNGIIEDVQEDEAIEKIYYSEEHINSCLSKYIEDFKNEQYTYTIEAFKKSVKKYGGFYIARYETGKDEQGNIVIKGGALPHTNVTRDNALENSIIFYKENNSVTSSLINSYAWDMALAFINKTENNYYSKKDYVGTQKSQKTGESEDVVCNIFDLSGNVREWSTEFSTNGYYSYLSSCVVRGGYYNNSNFTASSRYYNGEDAKNEYIGYRIILYLK